MCKYFITATIALMGNYKPKNAMQNYQSRKPERTRLFG